MALIFGSTIKHVISKSSTLTQSPIRTDWRKFSSFREGLVTTSIAGSAKGAGKYAFGSEECARTNQPGLADAVLMQPKGGRTDTSLSFSGSNQAREGRLVDALAARGDEGRDTLR